jgi:hypothetical protein
MPGKTLNNRSPNSIEFSLTLFAPAAAQGKPAINDPGLNIVGGALGETAPQGHQRNAFG